MKVVHILASISGSWGGPPSAVRNLTRCLEGLGVENTVIGLEDSRFPTATFAESVKIVSCGNALPTKLGIPSNPLRIRAILRECKSADVIHIHEIWHLPQVLGALASNLTSRPYIISPHGELLPFSLSQRRRAKKLAWHSYQRRILTGAAMVHALTQDEAASIESSGVETPIRIIPNGIDVAYVQETLRSGEARAGLSIPLPPHYLLYLGRLDSNKGVEILLEAMRLVVSRRADIFLIMAGPDSEGRWPMIQKQLWSQGRSRVLYVGFIPQPTKFELLSEAFASILPSASEGMSMSILESLACGTPVITCPGSNTPAIAAAGAGKVVPRDAIHLAEAILDLADNPHEIALMRAEALRLATEKYSIKSVAIQMARLYENLLPPPDVG